MKDRFLPVEGIIKAETAKAYLLEPCEYELDGTTHEHSSLFIPKSNTHPDSLDTVDDAVRGDLIEVYVVEWWLREQ